MIKIGIEAKEYPLDVREIESILAIIDKHPNVKFTRVLPDDSQTSQVERADSAALEDAYNTGHTRGMWAAGEQIGQAPPEFKEYISALPCGANNISRDAIEFIRSVANIDLNSPRIDLVEYVRQAKQIIQQHPC